jgi:hypothetical protein
MQGFYLIDKKMTFFMLLPMVSFPTHREEKRNLVSDTQFHCYVGLALDVGAGWVDHWQKTFLKLTENKENSAI